MNTHSANTPEIYRLGDLLPDFFTFAEKLEESRITGRSMGPVTGFDWLDDAISGCLHPGYHVISAGSGAGKSAFCLQIACKCGCPAIYVTADGGMGPQVLLRRMIARTTSTDLKILTNCRLRDTGRILSAGAMKQLAEQTVREAPDLTIVDARTAFADPNWLCKQANKIRQITGSEYILLVLDSLHSWAAGMTDERGRPVEEYERLPLSIHALLAIADELKAPVLCTSEQSKEANKKADRGENPGVSAPAGNRSIEYQAETVITLVATSPEDAFGIIPVSVMINKNRNGGKSDCHTLNFIGKFQRFEEA